MASPACSITSFEKPVTFQPPEWLGMSDEAEIKGNVLLMSRNSADASSSMSGGAIYESAVNVCGVGSIKASRNVSQASYRRGVNRSASS